MLVLGKTRTGKTTLLGNLAVQDIEAGRGLCFIDPHGDEATRLLDYIPPDRADDLVYLDPAGELEHPVGFNVLEKVPPDGRPLVASHVVSIFRSQWRDAWGARSEHILYNVIAAQLYSRVLWVENSPNSPSGKMGPFRDPSEEAHLHSLLWKKEPGWSVEPIS